MPRFASSARRRTTVEVRQVVYHGISGEGEGDGALDLDLDLDLGLLLGGFGSRGGENWVSGIVGDDDDDVEARGLDCGLEGLMSTSKLLLPPPFLPLALPLPFPLPRGGMVLPSLLVLALLTAGPGFGFGLLATLQAHLHPQPVPCPLLAWTGCVFSAFD